MSDEALPPVSQGKRMTTIAALLLLALSGCLVLRSSNARQVLLTDESPLRQLSEALPIAEGDLKPLLPLEAMDYVGFVAAVVALLVAAGGGIGGGGLLVPIFLLVMDFHLEIKNSVNILIILIGTCLFFQM